MVESIERAIELSQQVRTYLAQLLQGEHDASRSTLTGKPATRFRLVAGAVDSPSWQFDIYMQHGLGQAGGKEGTNFKKNLIGSEKPGETTYEYVATNDLMSKAATHIGLMEKDHLDHAAKPARISQVRR